MTPAEAQALLTVAAAFDNRKPDPDAARAWAAALDGLPFADCRDAIVKHYRNSSDWLMPGHIIAAVKQVRAKRIADAGHLLIPPPGLTEPEERAWLGHARRRVADGEAPEVVSPQQIEGKRRLELVGPSSIDAADAVRDLREAHADAKRVLAEAAAQRNAERDERKAAREAARQATPHPPRRPEGERRMKLYVAGPMTGYPDFNYPAFFRAADDLRAAGFAPVNPARAEGRDGCSSWLDFMRAGLRDIADSDGVATLPGWEASRGAALEVHIARSLDLPVLPVETWIDPELASAHSPTTDLTEETR